MEQKKSPGADLESKKNMFFLFGLVISLGLTLLAFEWTGKPKKAEDLGIIQTQNVEEEMTPLTREPEVKPPLLPPPATVEVLNIVDNDIEIEDELEILDTEADDNTIIDIAPVIAQKKEEEVEEEIFFNIIEDPAEFPGGEKALYKFIYDNVEYPRIAAENGVEGKVIIRFVVDEQGNATNAEVIRPVDNNLDKEALRVINKLPKFRPGKQRGKAVKVYYLSTITFRLE